MSHRFRAVFVVATLFAFLVRALTAAAVRRLTRNRDASQIPDRARAMLERLGGLFVKLGQIIAMRPDLVGREWITATEKLLDQVAPFPGAVAVALIEGEFGRPIEALFAEFNAVPLAAASFAQVHSARLPGGTMVAVKVQRPGIAASVRTDLACLRVVVWLAQVSGLARRVRLDEMLAELEQWTLQELDLCKEAAFATAMRESKIAIPGEYIPRIFWSLTSHKVLTMELLEGVWLSEVKRAIDQRDGRLVRRLKAIGVDPPAVAKLLFEIMLRQVFERGIFHGDPHAGNLVARPDGSIGYVDFGITGRADARFQDIQMSVLVALGQGDLDGFYRNVIKFFYPLRADLDLFALRREIIHVVQDWLDARYNRRAHPAELSTAMLLGGVLGVARRHDLTISSVALRYFRAVIAIEALIISLDPAFPFQALLRQVLGGIAIRRVRRRASPDGTIMGLIALLDILQSAPARLMNSFTDIDDTSRAVIGSVNRWFSALAFTLRWAARAAGCAAVAAPFGLFDRLIRPGWEIRLFSCGVLICLSLVLAAFAQQLFLSVVQTSDRT